MADRELNTVLNTGELTEIHLGGITAGDKVVKQSELPTLSTLAIGFADYNDLATQSTAIVVPNTSTFVDLTNDELGPFTNKTFLPSGVTDVWDESTNLFDWAELALGDMVDIRIDIEVTTTSANQEILLSLQLATGGFSYEIPYAHLVFKSSGVYQINRYNGIYIGDTNTKDNGGKFRIKSDGNATVVVNGWYCKVILR